MSKTTVLIVEDEEIVAADLADKLGQLGYEVVGSAAEGEEAVEMACSLKPAVVLMDIRLKGSMDGIEAAEEILRRHSAPIIYLTAHSDPATLERAKLSEPFGYILKPFEERELSTTIEMALYKHKSELQLREQREWLRVTLSSIGDAVITCDTDGRVTFLNPVAEALTGWSIDEAREQPIREVFSLINEQTRQPPEDPVALVLREGRAKTLANHTAILTRDGREIPIEDSAAPIMDADGRVIGAVLVFHDVTQRRRAQKALRESEERLRRFYESGMVAVFYWNTDGMITDANDKFLEMTGYTREELIAGKIDWVNMTPPEYRYLDEESVKELKATGVNKNPFEKEYIHKNGTRIPIVVAGAMLDQERFNGVAFVLDITDRKRAEETLLEMNRRLEEATAMAQEMAAKSEAANIVKSQFLANMSHELRTPMTGVLGMLDIVLLGNLEAEQRESIETAHASARSLVRILNDILDLTKIEKGKFSIEDKPFSLRKNLTNTINLLLPVAKSKGLDLNLSVADNVPENLVGDQTRINQVLTNLAGNAVKFTETGKVAIRVTTGDSRPDGKSAVTFSVTDTGIGIPADKKELIFQYFTQVDESHTRSYGGTGLGLAISKEIAERMGGTITFMSEEGKGSTFSCTIPLGEAEPERDTGFASGETATAGNAPRAEVATKPRLLVAEDDQVTRKVLGMMLQMGKYETDFAENGQKAVEMWENGNYDLILMDVQMPLMNGFEATRAIRVKERSNGGHTPIVAMTAHALKEDEERCLAAGMDAYVSKPIDFKICLEVIGETLKTNGGVR